MRWLCFQLLSCCSLLRGDCSEAVLWTNPSFPHAEPREARLYILCLVCMLPCDDKRIATIRRTDHLFVCFRDGVAESPRQAGSDPPTVLWPQHMVLHCPCCYSVVCVMRTYAQQHCRFYLFYMSGCFSGNRCWGNKTLVKLGLMSDHITWDP